MKKWSYIIMLLGLCIVLYPSVTNWLDDRAQAKLLQEAEAESLKPLNIANLSSSSAVPDYQKLSNLLDEGEGEVASEDNSEIESQAPEEAKLDANALKEGQVLGVIRYDRLNIKLPIVEGATKENMKSAAVHVTGTGIAGVEGNMAVAAHRAHKTGRLFNRLNEAKVGDVIEIDQGGQTYHYEVNKIHIVEPTEVWVLDPTEGETGLTLITCDPLIDPTHRLIVYAVMKN
ncbi:class D sortase [Saccharibacillus kuerlensis]|uniref:Class C sortase n=1 Tax=Saccharibacillus kuerlensis TaxID=459527 RepID=A0ABQ2L2J6_9BACL|nr:class D sortase [Saccharibacillus kuerlensis]GGO00447.1 class C sortase [Saccharibacillus kuerlensis]